MGRLVGFRCELTRHGCCAQPLKPCRKDIKLSCSDREERPGDEYKTHRADDYYAEDTKKYVLVDAEN